MFASVRCYVVHRAETRELAERVEARFADLVAGRPGFLAYDFLDCGGGEAITVSVFREEEQAHDSRELARRWTEEELADMELTITESLHGEVLIHRGGQAPGGYASLRRYRLAGELPRGTLEGFADRIERLGGFSGYRVLDCGDGELLSISVFENSESARPGDALALEEARDLEVQRTDMVGGGAVAVSRLGERPAARQGA